MYCNLRIIGRHRDPELILRLYQYLSKPDTGFLVPSVKKKKRKGKVMKIKETRKDIFDA